MSYYNSANYEEQGGENWVIGGNLAGGEANKGPVSNVRARVAVADITAGAGATILPAVEGYAYRLVSATAISVGGAAGAATTVDIVGTLSASARKLVAFAQASLTRSTVLRDGASGAAVLADGASYTRNDVNTPITLGRTGNAITTATHIDVNINYVLEKV